MSVHRIKELNFNNIDIGRFEGDGNIIYRDEYFAVCSSPCFIPNSNYKYFTVVKGWLFGESLYAIRINMRKPEYYTGELSDDEIDHLIDVLSKPSTIGDWVDRKIYKDYDKSYIHTVWEDLNYFNDWNLDKDIDILPIPDYTKLNK